MKPYRSMLFVPGQRHSWVDKALASGADAIILDLEDAVPVAEKHAARVGVREALQRVAGGGPGADVWVRPNGWRSELAGKDLAQVVTDGLAGLVLPMVYQPEDVVRFDALLTYFEFESGIEPGSVELIVSLETAEALAICESLATASSRVTSLLGATAKDADVARSVGYEFTKEGLETLYLRSRVVLACRAAGLVHPICGIWQDVGDHAGLASFAKQNRQLGFRGQLVIHPSHVPTVNEIYTPADAVVAYYERMLAAFDEAEGLGRTAVNFEGDHIDAAHVKTAREVVAFRREIDSTTRNSKEI